MIMLSDDHDQTYDAFAIIPLGLSMVIVWPGFNNYRTLIRTLMASYGHLICFPLPFSAVAVQ